MKILISHNFHPSFLFSRGFELSSVFEITQFIAKLLKHLPPALAIFSYFFETYENFGCFSFPTFFILLFLCYFLLLCYITSGAKLRFASVMKFSILNCSRIFSVFFCVS